MKEFRVIFLAGAFWGSNKNCILENSIGVVQNAADVLQKNYIDGFSLNKSVSSVTVINIPFIGSYPRRYKKPYYSPKVDFHSFPGYEVFEYPFLNISVIKNISRLYSSFKSVLNKFNNHSKFNEDENLVLVCYSMHLPFLLACYFLKISKKKFKLCVIVPDLPEFMAVRHGMEKLIYNSIARISYGIVSRADCVVAITSQMLLKISEKGGVVIEGIASISPQQGSINPQQVSNIKERFFFYSGTLDSRYGIRELIDEFEFSGINDIELRICGEGDMKDYAIEASKRNKNIRYLGQIDRDEVLNLQRKALVLINPRKNSSEFTKYSFPSKIIEYMSSGTPVLMYRIDGVPEEYFDYCYVIDEGRGGLSNALKKISLLNSEILEQKGFKAQKFICERKNPIVQVEKIVDFMKGKF